MSNKKNVTKSTLAISSLSVLIALSGCATTGGGTSTAGVNNTTVGAVIGVLGGAVAGRVAGGKDKKGKNTAIGAILGGLAGAGVGAYMDKQQRELDEKLAKEQASKQVELKRLADNVIQLNLDSSATFASGSSTLNPNFDTSLNKIANILKSNDKTVVHVVGYTDSTGSEEFNQRLSEERADRVESFFNKQGIVEDRLRSQGLGAKNPIASNTTEDGRKKNRRVEIYLKPIIQGKEDEALRSPI